MNSLLKYLFFSRYSLVAPYKNYTGACNHEFPSTYFRSFLSNPWTFHKPETIMKDKEAHSLFQTFGIKMYLGRSVFILSIRCSFCPGNFSQRLSVCFINYATNQFFADFHRKSIIRLSSCFFFFLSLSYFFMNL